MAQNRVPHPTMLLTGAAGRIGSALWRDTAQRYHWRLADHTTATLRSAASPSHEVIDLDVTDLAACQRACTGMHTVVHLAADAAPDADFYASLLETNIKGTYNIFRAAKDQGCQRVVYASSAQVVEGYALDRQLTPDLPIRPKNMYGVSKCFGEAVAAYFAYQEELSSVVVRIANYAAFAPGQQHTARDISAYVSRRDLVHLLVQCIDTPQVPFAIVHGVSNNRFKRLDLTTTREALAYSPQDDGFAILGIPFADA